MKRNILLMLVLLLLTALAGACGDSPPSTGRAEIELQAAMASKQDAAQRRARGIAAGPAIEGVPLGVCCQHDGTAWVKLVGVGHEECTNGYYTNTSDVESVSCDIGACMVQASSATGGFVTCYDEVLSSWCAGREQTAPAIFYANTWCVDLGKHGWEGE